MTRIDTRRTRLALGIALTGIGLLLLGPAPASAQPPSCAGVADYAAEMALAGFSVEDEVPVGGGLVDIVVSASLTNQDVGDFEWLKPIFDFEGAPYGGDPTVPVVAMEFHSAWSLSASTSCTARRPRTSSPVTRS